MATSTKDYYQTLGVSRTASADEIKKAYRQAALKHHPDRAGTDAEGRFKEINEAYQVLSDPKKRTHYDQFGSFHEGAGAGGFGRGGFGAGVDFDDLFGGRSTRTSGFGFGNLSDLFSDVMGQAMSQVQIELPVRLTDLLLGGTIQFRNPATRETLSLTIPSGTKEGTTFQFPGQGGSHRRGRGDLFVIVKLDLPRRLTKEQERLVEELRKTGL